MPALVSGCGQRVVLPERYRARVLARPELLRFLNEVQWEKDDISALDSAQGVVCAVRPVDQSQLISRILTSSTIVRCILEKPLAPTPESAALLLDTMIRSGKEFRVAYTFRYTEWGKRLLQYMTKRKDNVELSIHWTFLSHHFRYDLHNWKRFEAEGGGAIRFYGIHLISLLAEIGYREVVSSRAFYSAPGVVERWKCVFAGPGLPKCDVLIDCRCATELFCVEVSTAEEMLDSFVLAKLTDPFQSENARQPGDGLDSRICVLIQLCHSLEKDATNDYKLYAQTLILWQRVEQATQSEAI